MWMFVVLLCISMVQTMYCIHRMRTRRIEISRLQCELSITQMQCYLLLAQLKREERKTYDLACQVEAESHYAEESEKQRFALWYNMYASVRFPSCN